MVDRFKIDRRKRGDKKIPCALCNGRPKFYEGALYWFPQDGYIRLIGHCCANKHDKEQYQRAGNELTLKDSIRESGDFLERHIPHAAAIVAELAKLERIVGTLSMYRSDLKTVQGVYRTLQNAQRRQNGDLKVMVRIKQTEVRKFLQDEGVADTATEEPVVIHRIEGGEMVDDRFSLRGEYHTLLLFFSELARESDATAYVIELFNHGPKVIDLAADFSRNIRRIKELHAAILSAVSFFSDNNLAGLDRYGRHKDSDVPFRVHRNGDDVRIELTFSDSGADFKQGQALDVPTILLPL
jgi:hypothetical protein